MDVDLAPALEPPSREGPGTLGMRAGGLLSSRHGKIEVMVAGLQVAPAPGRIVAIGVVGGGWRGA